jgi:hypothetical protein
MTMVLCSGTFKVGLCIISCEVDNVNCADNEFTAHNLWLLSRVPFCTYVSCRYITGENAKDWNNCMQLDSFNGKLYFRGEFYVRESALKWGFLLIGRGYRVQCFIIIHLLFENLGNTLHVIYVCIRNHGYEMTEFLLTVFLRMLEMACNIGI